MALIAVCSCLRIQLSIILTFELSTNGINAHAVTREFILVSEPKAAKISRFDLPTLNNHTIPLIGILQPVAIDYDPVDDRLFWTDFIEKEIRSAFSNGSANRLVYSFRAKSAVYDIAVDSLSRLVFYTDYEHDIIGLVTLTSLMHRTLISVGLDKPRAIVLDTMNGVMFWTDCGKTPKIERALYDGSDRRELVNTSLGYPTGLALDTKDNRLFWVDEKKFTVECYDLRGRFRTLIFRDLTKSVCFWDLALHERQVYITDLTQAKWNTTVSHLICIDTDNSVQKPLKTVTGLMANIHIFSSGSRVTGPNGCGITAHNCSHICIPSPGNTFKCICPDGETLQLASDKRTCLKYNFTESASSSGLNLSDIRTILEGFGLVTFVIIIVTVIVVRKNRCAYDHLIFRRRCRKEDVPCSHNLLDSEFDPATSAYYEIKESSNVQTEHTQSELLPNNSYLTVIDDSSFSSPETSLCHEARMTLPHPLGTTDTDNYLHPLEAPSQIKLSIFKK